MTERTPRKPRVRPVRECGRCGRFMPIMGRGFCSNCYRLVNSLCKFRERGDQGGGIGARVNTTPDLAAEPTDAIPGTPAKLAVLIARAEAGTQIFHPRDFPAGLQEEV